MWFTGKQFWAQTFEFRKVYGDTTEPQGALCYRSIKNLYAAYTGY